VLSNLPLTRQADYTSGIMRHLLYGVVLAGLVLHAVRAEVPTGALHGEAVNAFGVNLYRAMAAETPGNLVLSPYAAHAALLLAAEGARGETAAELHRVLHAGDDLAPLRASARALRAELAAAVAAAQIAPPGVNRAAQEAGYHPDAAVPLDLRIANRLFGQTGYPFRPEFLALLEREHAAPLEALDFHAAPEPARRRINQWVEERTAGRIRDLLTPQEVTPETRLTLVSALYFKARWNSLFAARDSVPLRFWLRRGENVSVPTMQQTTRYGYMALPEAVVVRLPYAGKQFHMLIVLPVGETSLDEVEALSTPENFRNWATMSDHLVNLYLPKFRLEPPTTDIGLSLRKLGLAALFDEPVGRANFEGIAPRLPTEYLRINRVVQKTFIEVSEEHTEAAAAVAVSMDPFGGPSVEPPQPVVVRVNRPFLFVIQHRSSGACLFLGRVTDPR
jgi:serpin B